MTNSINGANREESLSSAFHGHIPPEMSDEWSISTVSTDVILYGESDRECATTGEAIDINQFHLHATARRERKYKVDVRHWYFADEDALWEWMGRE